MGLKSRMSWMVNGAARTDASLATYATELRELQLKVEALTAVASRLDTTLAQVHSDERARVDGLVAGLREQLRTAVDDLGDRTGALADRLDSIQR